MISARGCACARVRSPRSRRCEPATWTASRRRGTRSSPGTRADRPPAPHPRPRRRPSGCCAPCGRASGCAAASAARKLPYRPTLCAAPVPGRTTCRSQLRWPRVAYAPLAALYAGFAPLDEDCALRVPGIQKNGARGTVGPPVPRLRHFLQRLQVLDQVAFFLLVQSEPESAVVLLDDVPQCRKAPGVEETALLVRPQSRERGGAIH